MYIHLLLNVNIHCISESHKCYGMATGREKMTERLDAEREKEELMKEHAFELQNYRMQKVRC